MAFAFAVTIDGEPLTHVLDVTGLRAEVDTIELKQQGPDGTYVVRLLPGRPKPGRFVVTQLLNDSTTIPDWLSLVRLGDVAGARKTCTVAVFDETGSIVRTLGFLNCWLQSVELAPLSAGADVPVTETFVVCYEESTIA